MPENEATQWAPWLAAREHVLTAKSWRFLVNTLHNDAAPPMTPVDHWRLEAKK